MDVLCVLSHQGSGSDLPSSSKPAHQLPPHCLAYPPTHLPTPARLSLQDVPGLPRLPHLLPAGIPSEREYVAAYCAARGVPPPPEASWCGCGGCRGAAFSGGVCITYINYAVQQPFRLK